MAARLKDIATAAGVSVGTVSDILNRDRKSLYSRDTCERVLAAARECEYRPNHAARAMRANKTQVVGFAAANFSPQGWLDNYPAYPFVIGLNHRLSEAGYHVGLVELAELEGSARSAADALPKPLRERFFDALVIHYGLSDRATKFAANLGLPLLWWDSGVFEQSGCIYRDEREVAREVTERLIAMGHRRIAYMVGDRGWKRYIAGEPVHYSYAHRFETYRKLMQDGGMLEMPVVGYDAASCAEQLARYKATAAIVPGGDTAAVTGAANVLGWQIPRDLSVASLDIEARVPQRTWIIGGMTYDRYGAGRQAAEVVLAMLAGGEASPRSVKLKGRFDVGQTICPPSKR